MKSEKPVSAGRSVVLTVLTVLTLPGLLIVAWKAAIYYIDFGQLGLYLFTAVVASGVVAILGALIWRGFVALFRRAAGLAPVTVKQHLRDRN